MTNDDIDESLKKKWIESLTKSFETEQNIPYILKCQGKFYFIIGKYEQVLANLTKLLDFEPNNAFALKYQGETYFMMEKYEESLACLDKLSKINVNDTWVLITHNEITRR